MRANQTLTYAGLRDAALQAVEASGLSGSEVARRLGKNRSSVSRALSESGGTFAKLQADIISELTGYEVEEVGGFVVRRKG